MKFPMILSFIEFCVNIVFFHVNLMNSHITSFVIVVLFLNKKIIKCELFLKLRE